jgi:hypothetical protein
VGYLLFPLHRKARLGGLFCLAPAQADGAPHSPMPMLRPQKNPLLAGFCFSRLDWLAP